MAKSSQKPAAPEKKVNGGGGEKIEVKVANAAQKLYWEELVGKNKITAANCPESITFNLYKLKAYLDEVEAEFTKLNVPYGDRGISVMPIAYSETSRFTVMFTPSVAGENDQHQHQFNKPLKGKKTSKSSAGAPLVSNYDFQLNPLNLGEDNP